MTAKVRLRYLAYGSNLHPERLQRRVPSARLLGATRLDGWALRFNKRGQDSSGKCNIVVADSRIHVAIYEMRAAQRAVLDQIEGVDHGYDCDELDVPDFGRCFFYRANVTHIDDVVTPFTWYKQLVLIGCALHRFPSPYIASIRSQPEAVDPNPARHDENMHIVNAAQANKSGAPGGDA